MRRLHSIRQYLKFPLAAVVIIACMAPAAGVTTSATVQPTLTAFDQVVRGRQLVLEHGCGDCHGGAVNPAAQGDGPFPGNSQWLAGRPQDTIPLGDFRAYPRNITPDDETGLGRFSERQIFNAIRFGLRPRATPDVEITSAVPG